MSTTFALVADLWGHVGPGLLLAFALPLLLLAFGLIILVVTRQVKDRRDAGDAGLGAA
jgi:hypothetical protein